MIYVAFMGLAVIAILTTVAAHYYSKASKSEAALSGIKAQLEQAENQRKIFAESNRRIIEQLEKVRNMLKEGKTMSTIESELERMEEPEKTLYDHLQEERPQEEPS